MAGAARRAHSQAARLGLLTALLAACASMQEPPGGPPDFDPPVVLAIVPDSGEVLQGIPKYAEILFNEVINEQAGRAGLADLIVLSPRPEELDINWKRTRITLRPKDGWQPGVIYHLTLLPGITDLRANRLDSGRTVVFSTGGPIPATEVRGTVLNWEDGRSAARALIELILLPDATGRDSLAYVTQADSVGDFSMASLPQGRYLLAGAVDQNNNRERDRREAFDSVTFQLDSTSAHVLWAFVHDTLGPNVSGVEATDSVTVRVEFNQMLQPGPPDPGAVQVFALPDTTPVPVRHIWDQVTYDSVRAVERAIADSIRAAQADSAGRDSLATPGEPPPTPGDTLPAVPPVEAPATPRVAPLEPEPGTGEQRADTSRAAQLLQQRPKLARLWFVRLQSGTSPGGRYLVTVRAANVEGAEAESQGVLVVAERPDST